MQEIRVQSLGREDPLEKGMATHSSILAWRIPWTEELGRAPGGLESHGSGELPWGDSHGGRTPWGRKELDTTEVT